MIKLYATKRSFLFSIVICFFFYGFSQSSQKTNYFLTSNYVENDVDINYSAVVAIEKGKFNSKRKTFKIELIDFLIEDALYKNKLFVDNDITGVSFPINTAVNMLVDIQILYGSELVTKQVNLISFKKNNIVFNTEKNVPFDDIKFKISKTKYIKKIVSTEIFTGDIKNLIVKQHQPLTENQKEEEYNRLMILGNTYLNKNNYHQAVLAYLKARQFTNESKPNSQIKTAIKYANKDNAEIDLTEYKAQLKDENQLALENEKQKFEADVVEVEKVVSNHVQNKKMINKNKVEVAVENDQEVEYEYEYDTPKNINTYASASNDDIEYEYEYEYENTANNTFVTNDAEYEYEYENVEPSLQTEIYANNEAEYEYEYVDSNGNTTTEVTPPRKLSKSNNSLAPSSFTQQSFTANKSNAIKKVSKPMETKAINNVEGFVKYKRDEQAVVSKDGKMLIPFGKYSILRYRSGFAKIKIKDNVEVKNIVCTGNNEEYLWSARIFENPWIETVVDKNGNYVDELYKKVEIYIVDNVNYRPKEELSKKLLNSYKDPNPFNGLTQISAHNLWNREHSKDLDVIEKRKEIEKLRYISKKDAFKGANTCRKEVSPRFNEVVSYYEGLGYQVILKEQ